MKTRSRTYEQIFEDSRTWSCGGYTSRHHAREDVNRALKNRAEERKVEVDTYVTAELEKLDMLEAVVQDIIERRHYAITPKGTLIWLNPEPENPFSVEALLEDDGPVLSAVREMINIQTRRTKLIGLDAPTKKVIEVKQHDSVDDEIAGLLEAMAAGTQGTLPAGTAARGVGPGYRQPS